MGLRVAAVEVADDKLLTAVHPQAFGQATGMARRDGTIVFNGLPPGEFPAPIFDIVLKGQWTVESSSNTDPEDFRPRANVDVLGAGADLV